MLNIYLRKRECLHLLRMLGCFNMKALVLPILGDQFACNQL